MNLEVKLLNRIDDPALSRAERVVTRCRLARELEEAGDFEGARAALAEVWQRVGERPVLDGDDPTADARWIGPGAHDRVVGIWWRIQLLSR